MSTDSESDSDHSAEGFDTYWRLKNHGWMTGKVLIDELRKAGYAIRSCQKNKSALNKLYHRIDKQLLCYDACSVEELRDFVEARGLPVESTRSREHTRLVETLEKDDDEPSFHKAMDLPAELRVRIYELYMEDFPIAMYNPTQPPLATISRHIRKEFLPVFYKRHEFVLKMRLTIEKKKGCRLQWTPHSDCFIKSLHPTHLAMMRKINIEVHSEVSNAVWNVGVQLIYNFRVQLGDAKHSCSVEAKRCLTRFGESSTEWETKLEPLKERVRFTFEAARHRTTEDKTPQLKLEDIGAARRKMEAWLGAKQNKFALD